MVEVLLFVNIGLLVVGSVTLTIAVFVLQKARGYVDLAEERMERLRKGQEKLFELLHEGHGARSVPASEEGFAGPKVEELEKELRELRQSQNSELYRQRNASRSEDPPKSPEKNVGLLMEKKSESGESQVEAIIPSTTKPSQEPSSVPTRERFENKKAGVAVKHAHPDDDISLQRERTKQGKSQGDTPVKMFREHYHRYLENYEGYVKLAERLCQMREDGEVTQGSPAEREWEQKLRRLNDGIRRTTARLDILEQYNPELANDERISHRAGISQSYSELEKKLSGLENP